MPEKLDRCVREVMATGKTESQAFAICKARLNMEDKRFTLPETKRINNVEIFASGTWNGDYYTNKDLDEMVSNFEKTKDNIKPFLKLGHTENQKLAQSDGLPALGYIENLRRIGDKLVADFIDVPKKIFDLIQNRAYSRVSSEIFLKFKVMGKKFGKVLKAVALLGGDLPAVQNLKDIMALYSMTDIDEFKKICASHEASAYGDNNESVAYSVEKDELIKEDTKMEELEKIKKELANLQKKYSEAEAELVSYKDKDKDALDKMKKKMKELEDENNTLKGELSKSKQRNNTLEEEKKKEEEKVEEKEVEKKVDELVEDKKIAPAQKDQAKMMLLEAKRDKTEVKFKVGEEEVDKYQFVLKFFEKNIIDVNTDEHSEAGDVNRNEKTALIAKANKYKEEHGCDFGEALIAVSDDKTTA